jgi:UDP-4-amino-4-deoxy-L-arabinose formyltransferase/UDP-glucuronic acid dehydrogenase (UDP-4-keto-hexauronic acid decarboxylating)
MKIALVAEESAGAQAIKRTMTSGHEIVFVLTQSNRDIPVLTRERIHIGDPRNVKNAEFAQELRRLKVDVLLNVHSLISHSPRCLRRTPRGCFQHSSRPTSGVCRNQHCELGGVRRCPRIRRDIALAHGGHRCGAGSVPRKVSHRWRNDGRPPDGAVGPRRSWVAGSATEPALPAPREVPVLDQDRSRRRYYDRSVPHNGRIHWADAKAAEIDALVRACDYDPYPSPWGKVATTIKDTDVQLTRVVRTGRVADKPGGSVGDATSRGVLVAASDEWLEVLSVIVGGQPMSGRGLITHFIP